jgi:molecular chaperone GrpE (heat shock protein)
MKDRLLRALAEMENLRERSARQIESNKQFAVQVPSRLEAAL